MVRWLHEHADGYRPQSECTDVPLIATNPAPAQRRTLRTVVLTSSMTEAEGYGVRGKSILDTIDIAVDLRNH